ncbi:MAG: hypothetical protein HY909_15425 [Deltaproteobacteria bacterium]|nr:hypothetical protein [Deltaproteobacteria bacterium]
MTRRRPQPARTPHTIPLLASLSALLGVGAGCETASCGTRADELQHHGATAARALRQGSATEGLRQVGVATGLLPHAPSVVIAPVQQVPSVGPGPAPPPSSVPEPMLTLGEPVAVTPVPPPRPTPPSARTPPPRAPGAAPLVHPPAPRPPPVQPPPVQERNMRMGDMAMVTPTLPTRS